MPLIHGKSPASFEKNVKTEMHHDKPLKQSLAIAYAMKRKAKKEKMAHGGYMADGGFVHEEEKSGYVHKPHSECYAKGGFVEEEEESGYRPMPKEHEKHDEAAMMESDRMLNQHGQEEEGADGMEEDNESQHERMYAHPVENQDYHEDMVGRIMAKRQHHYSEGGRVANDSPIEAGFEDNQFDDLVKDDDLHEHYDAKNSGDEIGDEQEDEDRHNIVSRIMKSRRLKDRMPHPA
jgi:hypothetical protein